MTPEDVTYWMGQTSAAPRKSKPVDLSAMVRALAEADPPEYMLIDPRGRVFKGPNPMVLAAHAMPRMPDRMIFDDPPFQF